MAFEATVIKSMIASPSDVAAERNLVEKTIHDWNSLHSTRTKIVMLPVSWEKNAAPSMHDRPQAIINKQVLEDTDLLIGVFWTRLGSPTGTHPSGTVEEIDRHRRAGKRVMLYFSSAPVRPESIDSTQYDALLKFRKQCESEGLCESYESLSEFQEKLQRQLTLTIYNEYVSELREETIMLPQSDIPELSEEATVLLREACLDRDGIVMKLLSHDGLAVQANGRQFAEMRNRRSEAAWEAAVDELEHNGLIQDMGHKGEVFSITHEGYRVADLLQAT